MIEQNKIHQGDCLELMKQIDDKSVDMVLCDLPYGVTNNPEDIPLDLKYSFVDNVDKHGEWKFPTSLLRIQKPHPSKARHRTEKPVELAEYLIKTYSNEGDLVLDNCIGSGWAAIACRRLKRNFIGIEKRGDFVEISNSRLQEMLHTFTQTEVRHPPKALDILPTVL